MKKIAQIGTFNVDNLGDLLFPLVFQEIIKDICYSLDEEYQIVIFSPNCDGYEATYTDQIEVRDLLEFDQHSFDHVFIGGGDLLRSDDWSINRLYKMNNLSFTSILSPTNKSINNLNTLGIGVPFELDEGFAKYICNSFKRFQNISVRDSMSRKYLIQQNIEAEIVPDIVVSISKYFPKEIMQIHLQDVLKRNGYSFLPTEYIVFQANDTVFQDGEVITMGAMLNELSSQLNVPIVLLSIGECLGDNELFGQLSPLLDNYYIFDKGRDPSLKLIEKVSILANAGGFIGSSLHGNIISYSYGIPFLTFTGNYSTKIAGFFQMIDNEQNCFRNPSDFYIKKQFIIEHLSKKVSHNDKLEHHINLITDFVKRSLLSKSNNGDINSYSTELDQLFKIEQAFLTRKNLEISNLWERVNSSEEKSNLLELTNSQLWKRVNDSENKVRQLELANSELWERVSISENKTNDLLDQNKLLWQRVNDSETNFEELTKELISLRMRVSSMEANNTQLNESLQKLNEENQSLSMKAQNLLVENNQLLQNKLEYESTLYYRIKQKISSKGNQRK